MDTKNFCSFFCFRTSKEVPLVPSSPLVKSMIPTFKPCLICLKWFHHIQVPHHQDGFQKLKYLISSLIFFVLNLAKTTIVKTIPTDIQTAIGISTYSVRMNEDQIINN